MELEHGAVQVKGGHRAERCFVEVAEVLDRLVDVVCPVSTICSSWPSKSKCLLSRSSGRTGSGIWPGNKRPQTPLRYSSCACRRASAQVPLVAMARAPGNARSSRGPPPTSSRPLVPTKGAPAAAAHVRWAVQDTLDAVHEPLPMVRPPAWICHVPDMPFPETDPEYVIASEPTVPKDMEEP